MLNMSNISVILVSVNISDNEEDQTPNEPMKVVKYRVRWVGSIEWAGLWVESQVGGATQVGVVGWVCGAMQMGGAVGGACAAAGSSEQ